MLRPLLLVLAAPLLALTLTACSGEDASPASGAAQPTASTTSPLDNSPIIGNPARNIPAEKRDKIKVIPASADLHVGVNNFVFGITNLKNEPQGGAKTRVTFYDLRDPANPKPVLQREAVEGTPGIGAVTQHTHDDGSTHKHGGQDENRVGYFVTINLPWAGGWGFAVEATLKDGTQAISSSGFDVTEKPQVPAPGEKAIPSDNLTRRDVTDIRQIDSGNPPNDMHEVKIKDALAAGRPLVIVLSTPAYCTSAFCGPVTEEVESLQDLYKDKVDFVHVEIWLDFQAKQYNPTAREWLLRPDGRLVEPYVFIIDRQGTIYDRFEGPFSRNILEPAVKAVAEGKTYTAP